MFVVAGSRHKAKGQQDNKKAQRIARRGDGWLKALWTLARMTREQELLLKLFTTGHLNVPERSELSGGAVRASVARELITERLMQGCFPGDRQFAIGNVGGEYLQLELTKSGRVILLRNTEAGPQQYIHQTKELGSTESAVGEFLREREQRDLDGLKIDWSS